MGNDFARKVAKSHKKKWDNDRLRLGTPDLFSVAPTSGARTLTFDVIGKNSLAVGQECLVERSGDILIARQGRIEVARISKVPTKVMQAVDQGYGFAKGVACQVNVISGTVEISLC